MNKNQTTKLYQKLFENGYEYTILRRNKFNISWKYLKVTCMENVTTNLYESVSYKVINLFLQLNECASHLNKNIRKKTETYKTEFTKAVYNTKIK